jgi:hypothetical protein
MSDLSGALPAAPDQSARVFSNTSFSWDEMLADDTASQSPGVVTEVPPCFCPEYPCVVSEASPRGIHSCATCFQDIDKGQCKCVSALLPDDDETPPLPQFMELDCMECNEEPCICLLRKVALALKSRPRCENCQGTGMDCACPARVERFVLVSSNGPVVLPVRLYSVVVKARDGAILKGIPRCSFPVALEKVYLTEKKGSVSKDTAGDDLAKIAKLVPWGTREVSAGNIRLWKPKKSFELKPLYDFDNEVAKLAEMVNLSQSSSLERKKEGYKKLSTYFSFVGEIFLELVCEELSCGKIAAVSKQALLIDLEILRFCGLHFSQEEINERVKESLAEIVQDAQQRNAAYSERAHGCRKAGNLILALLFDQLTYREHGMGKARKEFILIFLKDTTNKGKREWKNPSSLLSDAKSEARNGPQVPGVAARVVDENEFESQRLRYMAENGVLWHDPLNRKNVVVPLAVLERIVDRLNDGQIDGVVDRLKRLKRGDFAYVLDHFRTSEELERGDAVYIVYGDENDRRLKCTKHKPSDPDKIFARSVVAGAGGLDPHTVATPYGGESFVGVQVVYLGHAYVKVDQSHCESIRNGVFLCASTDGYAVPEGSSPEWASRLGQALGPPFPHGDKWLVEAFVFVGQGATNRALARFDDQVKRVITRMDALETDVATVKETVIQLEVGIENLEIQDHLKTEQLEVLRNDVSDHSVLLEALHIRSGQIESSVADAQTRLSAMEETVGESTFAINVREQQLKELSRQEGWLKNVEGSLSRLNEEWNAWPMNEPRSSVMQDIGVRLVIAKLKKKYLQFKRRSFFKEQREITIELGQFPLVMVAADKKYEEVSLERLWTHSHSLLFGAGGIGKSTFCKSLCRNWACVGATSDFDCLLYVDLATELVKPGTPFVSLSDVIFVVVFKSDPSSRRLCDDFTGWLSKPDIKIMWVLDGYDQVEHIVPGTIFEGLRDGSFFAHQKNKHVLLVTRAEVTEGPCRIEHKSYHCYELMGFCETTVERYIEVYFDGPAKRGLLEELQNVFGFSKEFPVFRSSNRDRPRTYRTRIEWIHEAAKNPLMLELICNVVDGSTNLNDVSRKTQLYEKAFDLWLQGSGEIHKWWGKGSKHSVLKELWKAFCCTAWTSLDAGKKGVVSSADLSDERIVESGLLEQVGHDTWSWINFTFQEFFAAKWVCHYMPSDQVANALKRGVSSGKFGNVFIGFLFGMGNNNQAIACLEQWARLPLFRTSSVATVMGHDTDVVSVVGWIDECAPESFPKLQAFLRNHWPDDETTYRVLAYAASRGSLRGVTTLVDFGGSPGWALYCAAKQGHIHIVKWVSQKVRPVDVCVHDETPLLAAAKEGHDTVVKHLLGRGANPHIVDAIQETALSRAVWSGNIRAVQLLLPFGHLEIRRRIDEATPLSIAAREGFVDSAALLLEAGAIVDSLDAEGMTPLHIACHSDNVDMARLLVRHGANVNAVIEESKATPLHLLAKCLCSHSLVELVAFMIANGADRHAKNSSQQSPWDVANESLANFPDVSPVDAHELLRLLKNPQ